MTEQQNTALEALYVAAGERFGVAVDLSASAAINLHTLAALERHGMIARQADGRWSVTSVGAAKVSETRRTFSMKPVGEYEMKFPELWHPTLPPTSARCEGVLMVKANAHLLPYERRLLDVLQARRVWMSRRDIAHVLQHEVLQNSQVRALNWMAARGLIEVRSVPAHRNTLHYEYRAIPPVSEAITP